MKNVVIIIMAVLLGSSCTGFLDESNKSNFTPENYFRTAEHAQSIVNAIYADFRMSAGGDYGGNPYFMTDFLTGTAGTRVGQNVHINKIRTVTNDSDNEYSRSWWNAAYRAIANACFAIERIPAIDMDNTAKSRYLGEARFLRAYHYFNLVRLFGRVPLVLTPVDASSPELYPEQASVEDVYAQIVADLTEAERTELPWADESGRVTMGAVKSLLGTVYLTMAGYPLGRGREYCALSASKLREVIDRGVYRLFDSYADLHSVAMDNRLEHIFMVQYQSGSPVENGLQYLYLPYNLDISYYSTETGTVVVLDEFVASYEKGDRRTEEKEFYFTNYTSNANREETVEFGGYYVYKFFDEDAHLHTARSGLNYPLMRYADILLQYAEAQNEADGSPSAEAYAAVNAVRRRANIAELSGLSQDAFRQAVWRERWHELSYENKIWFDMARTRKVLNFATGNFDDYVGHQFTYGPVLGERELLFPIPTGEMKNNRKLTQNPGYN
ncbi:MAG: RagB/SusD family nutrient uptake outer membrane protein [Tannerella sp.]|nr:RagB/SusD family nutrient uptake outer membrane protein [Tannerella sp.]